MSTDFQTIKEIARASLMPDFFGVRIQEEGLFPQLQQLIAKIRLPKPVPQLQRIQQIAAASTDPIAFVDAIKAQNLWTTLREVLSRLTIR
jgi:hypothetical protein